MPRRCVPKARISMVINPIDGIVVYVPECDARAIFQEDELPEDQKIFIEVNAELAEIWPVQTEVKATSG